MIKSGWVGQTFALAKCNNDSGGKKSRIRRSKEERKALVESFIKKYQKLNGGTFPSLNLTHKEVGGSFYTVREIVREVIQENKVLGPAKFTPDQQSHDDIFEQYPIGSISTGSQDESLSPASNFVNTLVDHYQDTSEGLRINGFGEGLEKNEEHGRAMSVVSEDGEILVQEASVEDHVECKAKVTHIASDLTKETFPVTCGTATTYGLDTESSEASIVNGNSGEKEGHSSVVDGMSFIESAPSLKTERTDENLVGPQLKKRSERICEFPEESGGVVHGNLGEKEGERSVVDEMNFLDSASDTKSERTDANHVGLQLEKGLDLVDEKFVGEVEVPVEENSDDSVAEEDSALDTNGQIDAEDKNVSSAGIQVVDSSSGINIQNTEDAKKSPIVQIPTMVMAGEVNPKIRTSNGSKETNPTLDRINLESWERSSDKPQRKEISPLLAFLKACITAFVKFWSD